eukprot:CAMPEP_0185770448 /NCGR_PEP_ID=MMETSP1174-20130828/59164_1 /TAXON_ID=35687 /ORGANISM="Dictyocha speculum, Strain CCMP1381" /LENGTH=58 /DNA_ID=CAMNT_0028455875 /DNA_START=516 /DNA_END=692 /DNA_ORIENTATION=+
MRNVFPPMHEHILLTGTMVTLVVKVPLSSDASLHKFLPKKWDFAILPKYEAYSTIASN